jgi:putative ABC transport system substrate-binding protein
MVVRLNTRRRFLIALGSVVAAPGLALSQQSGRTYRLGWLSSAAPRTEPYNVAFVERLRELGFAEGRNLVIEFRNASGRPERLPEMAADLARQNCDVLIAPGPERNLVALKQASRNTPIVMLAADYDPVATGHVASLARPGGRITGVTQLQTELPVKRLELMRELLPKVGRVAVLADTSTTAQLNMVWAGAKQLGLELHPHEFKQAPYDYEGAFAEFARKRAEALLALASGFFVAARRKIPELALRHRLPSMFNNHLWAETGGLLSYGPNFSHSYRRVAEMAGMILNGTKPAEIPVEQPTTFELVINLKTARTLGIAIPSAFRARAERLIE